MSKLSSATKIVRYSVIAVVIFILLGLAWWYFFLNARGDDLRATDAGRGAGAVIPSSDSTIGSTYGNIAQNFFGGIVANITSTSGTGSEENTPNSAVPRLWHIVHTPVAGAGFVVRGSPTQENTAGNMAVRFVERGTGYILEARPMTGDVVRITNTLVPRVHEAIVAENDVVILRSVNEAGSIVTNIGQATSTLTENYEPASLSLSLLPQNIRAIAIDPSGEEILYLLPENAGASVVRATWDGKDAERIITLGIAGWQMLWTPGHIVLVQNPSSNATSYAYELGVGAALEPLVRSVGSLSVLPRANSEALLYSTDFFMSARVSANASAVALPIRTIADKCVWAPGEDLTAYCAVPQTLPGSTVESFLRGEAHTADAWWRIDVSANQAELLYAPLGVIQLDVENPAIDSNGEHIVFMNAVDKSLWLLRIEE